MTARKKLRAIMAGKKLVLMPGAYDALSARVIEAEGFEALVAGGYAAVGTGNMWSSAPPFGIAEGESAWPWDETGLLARVAALVPPEG